METTPTPRPGFTLIELIIVTVVIGVLAMMAAGPLSKARDRGFVTAARSEVKYVAQAIAIYEAERGRWPDELEDLEEVGFRRSPDIHFCTFEYVPRDGDVEPHVVLEASHKRSATHVMHEYPTWGPRIETEEMDEPCSN